MSIPVCMTCPSTTVGCVHTNPYLLRQSAPEHYCSPPLLASSLTSPMRPDWTCGICGRLWRDWLSGNIHTWQEIRGPNP